MYRTVAYLSRSALHTQLDVWKAQLPWIKPFYAVKCNNLAPLLQWLRQGPIPVGVDCASQKEMEESLSVGFQNSDILFAQPCKSGATLMFCSERGISRTIVDCEEEVTKLAAQGWTGEVLIRLAVPDKGSRQPFSSKFGATLFELPGIFRALCEHSLNWTGFSFHVGSECMNPEQFYTALEICKKGQHTAAGFGFTLRVLDIGGGFIPEPALFQKVAKMVGSGRKYLFAGQDLEWIAEPGRFLAQPTVSLEIPILGAKKGRDVERVYTLDESIYGMFSCIPFDHQTPVFFHQTSMTRPLESARIFGRTCDSADVLADRVFLPRLSVGDHLHVDNMGAYTFVSSSEFNGFPKPDVVLLE